MKTIFKYQLETEHLQTIKLPKGAKVLTGADQRGTICIWAEVDTDNDPDPEERTFAIYGTGHPMKEGVSHNFITTFFVGPFVWHLYEVI